MAGSKLKWIVRGFGALVALLAVLLVVAIFYLGVVVKTAVETVGPRFTGTTVTLEKAQIRPLRGKAWLKGLVVGNPKGYDAPQAIALGELNVELAPRSVLTDRVLIHSVLIDGPEITIEGSPKNNNLTAIADHVAAMSPGGEAESKPDQKPAPGESPAKQVVIERLVIRNGTVHFGTMLAVPLPEIIMTDIGKDQKMTMADITKLVLEKVLDSALGDFSGLKDTFESGVTEAGAAAKEGADKIGKALNDMLLKSGQKANESKP